MRPIISTLALANLLFFAWARWIDVPPAGHNTAAGAPLQLAPAHAEGAISAANSSGGGDPRTGPAHCVSLGPLTDTVATAAVATALRARNLNPRERHGPAVANDGYLVYIDHLGTVAARTRALKRLSSGGVRDAAALPDTDKVSVGLFNSKEGAEQRAATVRATGLEPIIDARTHTITAY